MLKFLKDIDKKHALKSWISLIISVLVFSLVAISVIDNLLSEPNELVQEVGIKTFRMFTVLSNILIALTAALSVPFAVDGIRNRNYHLPTWIVNLTFVSVTTVSLTFFMSLCVLAPQKGFYRIMISEGNLFLHTIIPILSIFLFIFVNDYHTIKFKTCFLSIIPVVIYALVYLISAIFIGEENGGWRDHYGFEELLPWPLIALLIFAVTFGITLGLRFLHNFMHKTDKLATAKFYHTANKYSFKTIEEVIIKIAKDNKKHDGNGDVIVPRRIIYMLEEKYKSGRPINELCNIYINEFLDKK